MAEEQRQLGVVRWFSAQRGYGFITVDSTGDDLFVHQTAILTKGFRTLNEGDDVEFSVETGLHNRVRAVDVALVSRKVYGSYGSGYGNTQRRGGDVDDSRVPASPGPCYTCGKMGHFATDCRSGESYVVDVRKARCYTCGKIGHFARDCR